MERLMSVHIKGVDGEIVGGEAERFKNLLQSQFGTVARDDDVLGRRIQSLEEYYRSKETYVWTSFDF